MKHGQRSENRSDKDRVDGSTGGAKGASSRQGEEARDLKSSAWARGPSIASVVKAAQDNQCPGTERERQRVSFRAFLGTRVAGNAQEAVVRLTGIRASSRQFRPAAAGLIPLSTQRGRLPVHQSAKVRGTGRALAMA